MVPPMTKQELLEQVAGAKGPVRTIEVLLLMDDLIQREALLAGEIGPEQVDLAVLTLNPTDPELVLPVFLLPVDPSEGQDHSRLAVDALWSRYFHHAARVGARTGSKFLKGWVGFEVGLRNAVATARAQGLDLDPTAYLVAPDLGDRDLDFTAVVSAWSSATDPLAAQEILDKARWEWVEEHGRWFSFKADEIEAYAAKLILLHRWRRLLAERPRQAKTSPDS
jgi:hypothetical protein